eukprot:TRINITY_DN116840_c0_g1_i1.p1 TRINITY_DN116840_c0_g1~~TRINITY_DN116840_c0_g1_i1.p1  ORF type:complete len:202 (+),score=27.78 TRINITY_DN116840_c0_g1_i1:71-607(+)
MFSVKCLKRTLTEKEFNTFVQAYKCPDNDSLVDEVLDNLSDAEYAWYRTTNIVPVYIVRQFVDIRHWSKLTRNEYDELLAACKQDNLPVPNPIQLAEEHVGQCVMRRTTENGMGSLFYVCETSKDGIIKGCSVDPEQDCGAIESVEPRHRFYLLTVNAVKHFTTPHLFLAKFLKLGVE